MNVPLGQKHLIGLFQHLIAYSLAASHSHRSHRWDQNKSGFSARRFHGNPYVILFVRHQHHTLRQRPLQREIAAQPNLTAGQQTAGDFSDCAGVFDFHVLLRRPLVKGKNTVPVRRSSDDRLRSRQPRNPLRQAVSAADMAACQRDAKARCIIQRKDGGIGGFADQIGGCGPHRNPRRADE